MICLPCGTAGKRLPGYLRMRDYAGAEDELTVRVWRELKSLHGQCRGCDCQHVMKGAIIDRDYTWDHRNTHREAGQNVKEATE